MVDLRNWQSHPPIVGIHSDLCGSSWVTMAHISSHFCQGQEAIEAYKKAVSFDPSSCSDALVPPNMSRTRRKCPAEFHQIWGLRNSGTDEGRETVGIPAMDVDP